MGDYSRLSLIASDLAERLRRASADAQRQIAAAACELALRASKLDIPEISLAIQISIAGNQPAMPANLPSMVEQLDEAYFDLKDRFEEGRTDEASYLAAFQKARAATAVMAAFCEDPLEAAMDALYEAHAAGVNIGELENIVDKAA